MKKHARELQIYDVMRFRRSSFLHLSTPEVNQKQPLNCSFPRAAPRRGQSKAAPRIRPAGIEEETIPCRIHSESLSEPPPSADHV